MAAERHGFVKLNSAFLRFTTIVVILIAYNTERVTSQRTPYVGKFLGKLSELHHGVSGEVYVVDGRTLHIKDFTYDGQGPAAYFYVGNSKAPSGSGFRIRDETGSPGVLKRYRKKSITLTLPDGKTLNSIKWFSVWCDEFSVNFGDVKIPRGFEYPKPQKMDPLRGVHGISSDNIVIVDAQTLLVPNLSYDGEAPDAKFWVGRGPKPSPQGIRVPDENGKEIPLRRYDRKTVVLTLPGDLTVFDIGHFGIWCEAFTVDFGHVRIPTGLNVPPSLKMLGISPQSKLNCEVLFDDLAFEVRWAVAGDSIVIQLVSKLEDNEYMSFGLSGDDHKSAMIGGDVTVAWVDKTSLKGYAVDYFLDDKSQCAGTRGSCPDERLTDNSNSVRLLNAAMVNGYSIVTYQRTLKPADELDRQILINQSQPIIWAVGPLNSRNEVSFHSQYLKGNQFLDFGRQPKWNCPMPETDRPQNSATTQTSRAPSRQNERGGNRFKEEETEKDSSKESTNERRRTSQRGTSRQTTKARGSTTTPRPVPTPKPVASKEAWDIPPIQCYEPEDGVFYAQMGPTGGKKGYSAITGHVGWGISWYINGLLIPEINVVRGKTYTFVVEGGIDPEVPARYHPFYITDDPVGGYEHRTPEERANYRIFAGVVQTNSGEIVPTGVGRLCHWTPRGDAAPEDFASFGGYQRTLELVCDAGEPGVITWTPDKNTPDTVYYQCFSHRYLGWRINVLDSCDSTPEGSDPVPSYHEAPADLESGATDEFKASPSILVETRIKPNNLHLYDISKAHLLATNPYSNKNNNDNDHYSSLYHHQQQIMYDPVQYETIPSFTDFRPSPRDVTSALFESTGTTESAIHEVTTGAMITTSTTTSTTTTTTTTPSPTTEEISTTTEIIEDTTTNSPTTTIEPEEKLSISESILQESKTVPDNYIYPQHPNLALPLIQPPKSYFPPNQMIVRRPIMNNMVRPNFMMKPIHSMGPGFGITNRPMMRPTIIMNNPNFMMKKPYFKPSTKRPVAMSTVLRPVVTRYPSKFPDHKPMMINPMAQLNFMQNYKNQKPTMLFKQPPPFLQNKTTTHPMIFPDNTQLVSNLQQSIFHTKPLNMQNNADQEIYASKIVKTKTPIIEESVLILQENNVPPPLRMKPLSEITSKPISTTLKPLPSPPTKPIPIKPTMTMVKLLSSSTAPVQASPMISIKPESWEKYITMKPARNTGFRPDSVVIESGFKPITTKPRLTEAEDRVHEETDTEPITDNIGVIDLGPTQDQTNDIPQQSTETFEPMFIPSPIDRRPALLNSTVEKTYDDNNVRRRVNNLKKDHANLRRRPVYVKYNKKFEDSDNVKSSDGDEMVMAAERLDSYYLPPSDGIRIRPSTEQPPNLEVPAGSIVSYDGKLVSSVDLPINHQVEITPKYGLSRTEQFIREKPQYVTFKGDAPPPIPENLRPETLPQLYSQVKHVLPTQFPQVSKFTNAQQFSPHISSTESTKLVLVRQAESTEKPEENTEQNMFDRLLDELFGVAKEEEQRQRREADHNLEHTVQEKFRNRNISKNEDDVEHSKRVKRWAHHTPEHTAEQNEKLNATTFAKHSIKHSSEIRTKRKAHHTPEHTAEQKRQLNATSVPESSVEQSDYIRTKRKSHHTPEHTAEQKRQLNVTNVPESSAEQSDHIRTKRKSHHTPEHTAEQKRQLNVTNVPESSAEQSDHIRTKRKSHHTAEHTAEQIRQFNVRNVSESSTEQSDHIRTKRKAHHTPEHTAEQQNQNHQNEGDHSHHSGHENVNSGSYSKPFTVILIIGFLIQFVINKIR